MNNPRILAILILQSISYSTSNFIDELAKRNFDFIVIGGGSAGATVAGRLTEDPDVNVLLLEAGVYPPFDSEVPASTSQLQQGPIDWKFKTTSQAPSFLSYDDQQCNYPRGKVLGGTSTINGMVYIRGNQNDFNHWSNLGNRGWSWPEVLPYFLKSEGNAIPWQYRDTEYHNKKGELTVSEAKFKTPSLNTFLTSAKENGYTVRDLNARYQSGVMPNPFTMRNGARCSTYNAFLQPVLHRNNLIIGTQSIVLKILFNDDKRAIGVAFSHLGKEYRVHASKEVILSAGVIGSPHILLLSGVGPASHLQKFNISLVVDLPGVGQNFQDHVGNGVLIWTVKADITFPFNVTASNANWINWRLFRSGPLTSPLASEAVGFINTPSADRTIDWPDVEILYASSSYANGGEGTKTRMGLTEEMYTKYLKPIMNQRSFGIRPFLMRPKSRGSIELQSANPFENPLIDPGYLTHPDDIKSLMEATKITFNFGNSSAFRAYGVQFNPSPLPGCENFPLFSDEYWTCTCLHFTLSGYHGVGSCKMGVVNDKLAVVDSELRVYGIKDLRLVDASIMPTIVTGNTNAATIMIAEKASEAIKRSYNLRS